MKKLLGKKKILIKKKASHFRDLRQGLYGFIFRGYTARIYLKCPSPSTPTSTSK